MMGVLRDATGPVVRELLVAEPIDLTLGAGPGATVSPLMKLHQLNAPTEQLERSLTGLVKDGLARETPAGIDLPR